MDEPAGLLEVVRNIAFDRLRLLQYLEQNLSLQFVVGSTSREHPQGHQHGLRGGTKSRHNILLMEISMRVSGSTHFLSAALSRRATSSSRGPQIKWRALMTASARALFPIPLLCAAVPFMLAPARSQTGPEADTKLALKAALILSPEFCQARLADIRWDTGQTGRIDRRTTTETLCSEFEPALKRIFPGLTRVTAIPRQERTKRNWCYFPGSLKFARQLLD